MKFILSVLLLATALRGTEAPRTTLTATFCRPADSTSAFLIGHLTQIATATEEPWTTMRDSLKVPAVSANQISLVTQESACKKAAERYNLEVVRMEGTPSVPRKVYLIKVGNTYAAMDPDYNSPHSEWRPLVLMNNQYKFLSAWGK